MPVHQQNDGALSRESSGGCEMAGERLQKHSSGVAVSTMAMKTVVMADPVYRTVINNPYSSC